MTTDIPGGVVKRPTQDYRIAYDKNGNGKIDKGEETAGADLCHDSFIEGEALNSLFYRERGLLNELFGRWKPAKTETTVQGAIDPPVRVTEKVVKLNGHSIHFQRHLKMQHATSDLTNGWGRV